MICSVLTLDDTRSGDVVNGGFYLVLVKVVLNHPVGSIVIRIIYG